MTEKSLQLLRDLVLLLRRYGPEHFEELGHLLGREEFTTAMKGILAELASQGQRSHDATGGKSSDPLEAIRSVDEAKYVLLRDAKEKLMDKRLHHSVADLLIAIESSGVILSKKSYRRREDVVRAFIQIASEMPTHELSQRLGGLGTAKVASDLSSWTNIIVPKKDVHD
jgi:hypothetical protein